MAFEVSPVRPNVALVVAGDFSSVLLDNADPLDIIVFGLFDCVLTIRSVLQFGSLLVWFGVDLQSTRRCLIPLDEAGLLDVRYKYFSVADLPRPRSSGDSR